MKSEPASLDVWVADALELVSLRFLGSICFLFFSKPPQGL